MEEIIKIISALSDGGSCSQSAHAGRVRLSSHRHKRKYLSAVSEKSPTNISTNLLEVKSKVLNTRTTLFPAEKWHCAGRGGTIAFIPYRCNARQIFFHEIVN